MRFILFEIYYRVFYTIGVMSIIECFSYFIQGHQLEYFSGFLAFNYQAVDFDSYGDLRRIGLGSLPKDLKQDDTFLLFENKQEHTGNWRDRAPILKLGIFSDFETSLPEKQSSHFFALSPNEGRAWFYLLIVCVSYFYCLEVEKATLNNVLIYAKLVNFCILAITQIYLVVIPGLLKKWLRNYFVTWMTFSSILFSSKSAIFIFTASFEELQLEQLDSELL